MSKVKKTIQWGKHTLSIETGVVARQATGAVMVSMGTTLVMVTVVGVETASQSHGLPLKVDYSERFYAAGKIPGGFFKREGRPTEREVLISRLIDRPLRPLFPEGFSHEVQVIATVLSLDPEVESDILAMIGASAALAISGIPFEGPLAAARVGYANGEYLLNPTPQDLVHSELDLVMACNKESVLMVESKADELPENVMLGAVMYGYQQSQAVVQLIHELAKEAGKPSWTWTRDAKDDKLVAQVRALSEVSLQEAYKIQNKQQRQTRVREIREQVIAKLIEGVEGDTVKLQAEIHSIIEDLASSIVRMRIVTGQGRIDGRDNHVVRPIQIETGLLPRTHGSALFTRGETQSIVAVTLGSSKDAQLIDGLLGEKKDPCILHYNFWPFSVGETGSIGSPKRREVGHGYLAKRGIQAVLPSLDAFPYVLRIVSEITESNGSSSMATVCGASLALMDAGVPVKSAVAGVAMGLIKEGSEYVVLTDILGDEDHLGDMDFKVVGTTTGVTALQMDIKINGITEAIMQDALAKAKDARLHILNVMQQTIAAPRTQLSDFAPRIMTFKINPDKIRDVIGKGGVVIRALTEETGAIIELQDDGTVQIMSVNKMAGDEARKRIELLTAELEVGQVYEGKVVRLAEFGAFVNLLPGKDGLLHISQISHQRVEDVGDVLQEGQIVKVEVIEIDRQGRVRLSMKSIIDQ